MSPYTTPSAGKRSPGTAVAVHREVGVLHGNGRASPPAQRQLPARRRLRGSLPRGGRRFGRRQCDRLAQNGCKARVLCGMAIASTKCAWKRGSSAVSIFSTRRTIASMVARERASSSAIRAPVPAALPAEATCESSQSGIMPSTIAYLTSMWLPNAPASRIRSTLLDAQALHQQPDARIQRGLRQLDGAHVVLRDRRAAARRRRST